MVRLACVRDEPCQDVDREDFVFVLQGFPRVGFVEKQIEEVQIVFLHRGSPGLLGSCRSRFAVQRGG
jgi:hypothetical protein